MMRALIGHVFLLLCLSLPVYDCIASQPACADIGTPVAALCWNDTVSSGALVGCFQVGQDAGGTVTGRFTSAGAANQCHDDYTITGSAEGNGQFYLQGQDVNPSPPAVCAKTFSGTVSISGPGCAQGEWQWTNSSSHAGTDSLSMNNGAGVLPSGEAQPVLFYQFPPSQPGLAVFAQALEPVNYNFQGRLISESLPSDVDGCMGGQDNPVIPPPIPAKNVSVTTLADGEFASIESQIPGDVKGVTSGYGDQVGFPDPNSALLVDEIRASGVQLPCSITTQQVMSIDTATAATNPATGSAQYQTNTLIITITPNSLIFERGPPGNETVKSRNFPSLAATLDPIIDLAIFDAKLTN